MKIEGKNAVRELLKTKKTVDKIVVMNGMRDAESRDLLSRVKQAGIKVQFCDKSVLDKESESRRHQGFIAYVSDYRYRELDEILSDCREKEDAFLVLLDGVEDPHNLGSIIRVCECAGVDGLVIGKHRSASVTDAVMRISEGSANHLKIARVVNLNSAIEQIKKENVWVYALELGGQSVYQCDLNGRICFVVGGEDTGVNKLTREKCDGILSIPMYGKVNSLNASVATGIGVFEAMRRRKNV
ncbi:MAG: 23S rRNA (guanosine(2251)-2'-O)-methyltransferase RlmB [Candidatus Borkfalkiaceae bacterium]|nr:23S rRNA (guanosine(2251)-2'-O)-methyltransferase RlmB [Christensenellaceae bacterium]